MKQKLKTRSSAAKRYRKTRTGKVVRRMAYKGHILEKKSQKRLFSKVNYALLD
jgi:large subunit ribosomal protein L35